MTAPATAKVTVIRGADWRFNFQAKSLDSGDPVNIEGWTLSASFMVGGVAVKTVVPTITDGANGKFSFVVANDEAAQDVIPVGQRSLLKLAFRDTGGIDDVLSTPVVLLNPKDVSTTQPTTLT